MSYLGKDFGDSIISSLFVCAGVVFLLGFGTGWLVFG